MTDLFSPFTLGSLSLKNRAVMSPMTRSRSIGNVPGEIVATYYAQRAGAGLIITEGTAPSPNALGYPRIPGLFSKEQVDGWRAVTKAVHDKGGAIFAQLMHTGRVGHPLNMPAGARLVAPSAIAVSGKMYTDQEGPLEHPAPIAMSAADIREAVAEFASASKNAIEAGFDGVELHGANGYLIEQFLCAKSNTRTDEYGGSVENRVRFAVEVARAASDAIGAKRVGIRLSPYGVFNDTGPDEHTDAVYTRLAEELGKLGLAYVHLVDHAAMGAPPVKPEIKAAIRKAFGGPIILSGGYDLARANADLAEGKGELVAFGRPFLANPDLVDKLKSGAALKQPDMSTFYTPGEKGYTDY